jgi:hypothetical protein
MAFDPITAGLEFASKLIDRLLPDKAQNDAAKAQMAQLVISGDIQGMLAQLAVNQAEAGSQNVFVAGWRPFVGWACGFAFVYTYIVQPFIQTILVVFHSNFDPTKLPVVNITEMLPVLFGMLGLGAMRSWDKSSGNGNGH